MASQAFEQESFDMGRVVNRTFGAISRNAALFFTLAIVLLFIPGVILQAIAAGVSGGDQTPFSPTRILSATVLGIVSVFFNYVLAAAISYATVLDLNGGRAELGPSFAIGLKRAIPLFLLAIASVLGIYLGLALLIIPGLMFAIWWSVATPVLVTENLGVFASMGRSRALTKGSRWSIFGLLFVVGLLLLIPLIIAPLMSGALTDPALAQANVLSVGSLITIFLSAIVYMIFAALLAAIYVELRTIKEGVTTESLAAIFA